MRTAETNRIGRNMTRAGMRILVCSWVLPAAFLFAAPPRAEALTAGEIIDRMEANQTHSTAILEGRMVISDRFGDRTSTYIAHSEGADRFLVEFTSRAEEGQRVLRRDDSLYLYYPDARETIRIQGAALRDSLLGSDISYEDMTGGSGLAADYRFNLLGEDTVEEYPVYKVELIARTTSVAYPRQVYWIDREEFVLRRAEQFARSGRLLKTTYVLETMRRDGYHFPSRIRVVDETRRSSGTEMIIEDAQLGVGLPRNIFSLEELTW